MVCLPVVRAPQGRRGVFTSRAGSGTVPLISTGTSGKAIAADLAALTANASLPAGCTLQKETDVVSVRIKPQRGLSIFFR